MTSSDEDRRDDLPEDDGPSLDETIDFDNKLKSDAEDAATEALQGDESLVVDDLGDLGLSDLELEADALDALDTVVPAETDESLDTLIPPETRASMKIAGESAEDAEASQQAEESPALGDELFLEEIGLDDSFVPDSDASTAPDDSLELQLEEEPVIAEGEAEEEADEDDVPDIVKFAADQTETMSMDDINMSLETVDFNGSPERADLDASASDPTAEGDVLPGPEIVDWQESSHTDQPPEDLIERLDLSSATDEALSAATSGVAGVNDAVEDGDFEFQLEDEAPAEPDESETVPAQLKLDAIAPSSEPMQVAPAVTVKRNPVLTVLKLGLGAVVGLVLFQIGAWWAGFDWFGLAPKLPDVIAWMAPANLRVDPSAPVRPDLVARSDDGAAADSDDLPVEDEAAPEPVEPRDDAASTVDPPVDPPGGPGEVRDPAADGPPMQETFANDLVVDLPAPSEGEGEPTGTATSLPDTDFEAAVQEDKLDAETATMDAVDLETPDETQGTGDRLPAEDPLEDAFGSGALESLDSAPAAGAPERKVIGPLPPRWFSDKEVLSALTEAKAADQTLDGAQLSGSGIKKAARDFYVALATLAEQVTWTEPAAAESVAEAARQLAAQFEFDEKKLKLIGNAARQWFDRDLGKGIALTGIVQSVEPGADVTQLGIQFLGRASQPVSVIVRAKDGNAVLNGQRLLVMGTIVDNPMLNFRGYDGPDDRVVWAGLVYPLP